METVQHRDFNTIIPVILAKRTKWGSSIAPDKILTHQNKHIENPLTNIKVLE
jgi:hypothetical protein